MTTAPFIVVTTLYLSSVFFGIMTVLIVIDIILHHKTGKGLNIFRNANWNK